MLWHFSEPQKTENFKTSVVLPYFKDIWRDLSLRSDNPKQGINKLTLIDYFRLPVVLTERIFEVFNAKKNGYLDLKEFSQGLVWIYFTSYNEKIKFVFKIYDYDRDGKVTKKDIMTLICCMPVVKPS